jgi:hypothetical protein
MLRLEAGLNVLNLEDEERNGLWVSEVDLGSPEVREVVAALPTRDGNYDTTRLLGPRVVSIKGTAVPSASGSRRAALDRLTAFLVPTVRPRLVFALEEGTEPRYLILRGSRFPVPAINHPTIGQFLAVWVAPDPVAYGLDLKDEVLEAGTATSKDWFDPRGELPGAGFAEGFVYNGGNYQSWPRLRIYGSCTAPAVWWIDPGNNGAVVFRNDFVIAQDDFVEIDTLRQSVLLNEQQDQSRYDQLNFTWTRWAPLEPGQTALGFVAPTYGPDCRLEIMWADATI